MASALALAARLGYSSVLKTRSDPLIMPRGGNAAAVADGAGSVGGCHAPCVAHVEAEVIAAAAETCCCCCCSSGLVQVVVLPVLAGTSCVVGSLPACSFLIDGKFTGRGTASLVPVRPRLLRRRSPPRVRAEAPCVTKAEPGGWPPPGPLVELRAALRLVFAYFEGF